VQEGTVTPARGGGTLQLCKPGKVRELAEKFKTVNGLMGDMGLEPFRLHTDYAGAPFWTLVLEREYEELEEAQELESQVFGSEAAKSAMSGYHELIVEGQREIYKVES
jgi:hypothetical protein